MDPPDHTRCRRLVSRAFTIRSVQALEKMVQATADRLLDDLADKDQFDVVEDHAALLPVGLGQRRRGSAAQGQPILTYLGGANRDPAVFSDPQTFDVTRPNANQHLAFSQGIHFCLGAGLARMEGVIGLRTLYERRPDLRVSGSPVRRDTRVLRGYEHIRVSSRS